MSGMVPHLHVQWGCGLKPTPRHANEIRAAWEASMAAVMGVQLVAVELVHCTNGDIVNMMLDDEMAAMSIWTAVAGALIEPQRTKPTGYDLSPVVSVGRPPEWCYAPHQAGDKESTRDVPLPTEKNASITQRPIERN